MATAQGAASFGSLSGIKLGALSRPPWEDQREWYRRTRVTGPDCAVMCNLINTHTHTHTHKILRAQVRVVQVERICPLCRA